MNVYNKLVFVPSSLVKCLQVRPGAYLRVDPLNADKLGYDTVLPTIVRPLL
jgi:hypothetical protein